MKVTDEDLLTNLTDQISEQRRNAEHWKTKYTSLKLSKLRTCADIGNKLHQSLSSNMADFSFSSCLVIMGSDMPELNITAFLGGIQDLSSSKPEHVNKAWTNLKRQWKRDANRDYHNDADLGESVEDDSAEVVNNINNKINIKDNVKRFRKMLTNIMTSSDDNNNKNKNKYSFGEGKPCTKEYFDLTSERPIPCKGKYQAPQMTPPEPCLKDLKDHKDQEKGESQSMPDSASHCLKDRHDEDNPLINLVTERGPRCDRKCYKMPNVEEQLRKEKAELEKKVERLIVLFRLYKAKAQSKLVQAKQNMEERIDAHKTQRKERVKRLKQQKQELRTKIRELKEKQQAKHDKEITALEHENRDLQNTIQNLENEKRHWERIERFNMRQNLDDLKESIERTKAKYVSKIKAMRKKFSKYVTEQKHKLKELTQQLQQQREEAKANNKDSKIGFQSIKLLNDRLQRKMDYYKARHSYAIMQIEQLQIIVKNAEKEQAKFITRQREQFRRSKRAQQEEQQQQQQQQQKQQYDVNRHFFVNDDDLVPELPIIPSVYCADQKHCMKGDDGIMEKDEQSVKQKELDMLPEEVIIIRQNKDEKSLPSSFSYPVYSSANKESPSSSDAEKTNASSKETTTVSSVEVDGKMKYFKITTFESENDDESATYRVTSLDDADANDEEEIFPPKPSPPRSPPVDFTSFPPGKPSPPSRLSQAGKSGTSSPPAKPTPPDFLKNYDELISQELFGKTTKNDESSTLDGVMVGTEYDYHKETKSAHDESKSKMNQPTPSGTEEPTEYISIRITEERETFDENGNKIGDQIVWVPEGPVPSLSTLSDIEIQNWLATERPNAEKQYVLKKNDLSQENDKNSNNDDIEIDSNRNDANQENEDNSKEVKSADTSFDDVNENDDVSSIWYDEETEK